MDENTIMQLLAAYGLVYEMSHGSLVLVYINNWQIPPLYSLTY